MNAINLNRIRSIKSLEALRKPLVDFIRFDTATMRDVYVEDFGWGLMDYEADIESAEALLEQIERRIKSLSHHLAKAPNAQQ